MQDANARREKDLIWGAALIDRSHNRGFWICGDNILKLKALGLVTLGKVQYHFKHDDLERKRDLAPYFWTVDHIRLEPSNNVQALPQDVFECLAGGRSRMASDRKRIKTSEDEPTSVQ